MPAESKIVKSHIQETRKHLFLLKSPKQSYNPLEFATDTSLTTLEIN